MSFYFLIKHLHYSLRAKLFKILATLYPKPSVLKGKKATEAVPFQHIGTFRSVDI